MATHTVSKILQQTDLRPLRDIGATYTGDTVDNVDWVVPENGAGENSVEIAFTAVNFNSLFLVSTVECRVTLTGATAVNGVAVGYVDLNPGVGVHVTAITGDVTSIEVGDNNETDGPAGSIEGSLLRNT